MRAEGIAWPKRAWGAPVFPSRLRPHSLRHAFAVHLLGTGNRRAAPFNSLLGHRSLATTARYLRIANHPKRAQTTSPFDPAPTPRTHRADAHCSAVLSERSRAHGPPQVGKWADIFRRHGEAYRREPAGHRCPLNSGVWDGRHRMCCLHGSHSAGHSRTLRSDAIYERNMLFKLAAGDRQLPRSVSHWPKAQWIGGIAKPSLLGLPRTSMSSFTVPEEIAAIASPEQGK